MLSSLGLSAIRKWLIASSYFSLFRRFKITERVGMEFRAESFNLTNTPHFGNPNGNVNSSNFGKITSDAGDPRTFRFGLRIPF